jgi:cytochrome c biogenesis protein CcdA
MVLGLLGRLLGFRIAGVAWPFALSFVAVILATRELELSSFELPEFKRQTEKFWAHEYGFFFASVMWGLHVGLGFATRMNYGGYWLLVVFTLASSDPIYGALLMVSYWLGRALPVWIAPVVTKTESLQEQLAKSIIVNPSVYHRLVGLTLVWVAVSVVRIALSIPLTRELRLLHTR